jgi:hypothetical protein
MHLLNPLSIKCELYGLVTLTALALMGTITLSGSILYHRMLDYRIDKMRTAAEIAAGYAQSLEDQVQAVGFITNIRAA